MTWKTPCANAERFSTVAVMVVVVSRSNGSRPKGVGIGSCGAGSKAAGRGDRGDLNRQIAYLAEKHIVREVRIGHFADKPSQPLLDIVQ